jgi:tRNA pseudouridine55 synthase
MVSAVKVGGERLHAKARRGEEVERAARPVSIFELNLVVQREGDEPEADIDVRCSSGTYVRTLINDIGEVLGCGAHMTALRRTETGGFTLADAKPLDAIGADDLLPLVEIVRVLPRIDLSETDATAVGYGRKLSAEAAPGIKDGQQVGLTVSGSLVAVYRREGDALVADRVVGS